MNLNAVNTAWTEDRILELVRKLRNDLIKDFLNDQFLQAYLASQFRVHHLSPVKLQLMRKDLRELLIAPVNTGHYRRLMDQIRETDSAGISEMHESLFYQEIDQVVKQYIYV